jgi:hypothetical protein
MLITMVPVQAGLSDAQRNKNEKNTSYFEDLIRNVGRWQDINHDAQRAPSLQLNANPSARCYAVI